MKNLQKLMEEKRPLWLSCLFILVIVLFVLGSRETGLQQKGLFSVGGGLAIWWAMLTKEAFPPTLQGIVAIANAAGWMPLPEQLRAGIVVAATVVGAIWLTGQIKLDWLGWLTVVCVALLGIGFATGDARIIFTANSALVVQSLLFWAIVHKWKFNQVAIGYLVLNSFMAYNLWPVVVKG